MTTGSYNKDSLLHTHNYSWFLHLLPSVQEGPAPGWASTVSAMGRVGEGACPNSWQSQAEDSEEYIDSEHLCLGSALAASNRGYIKVQL